MADNTEKFTILLRSGQAKNPKLEFDAFYPVVKVVDGVAMVFSGGDLRPIAAVPVDLLESIVFDQYVAKG
jgi:hypothetical protein